MGTKYSEYVENFRKDVYDSEGLFVVSPSDRDRIRSLVGVMAQSDLGEGKIRSVSEKRGSVIVQFPDGQTEGYVFGSPNLTLLLDLE